MAETGIRFMTFGISPYCEKARWALDWHRIRYREIGWPPGLHQILAKRCGAKTNALPILLEGTTVIQGSSAIIDWAERRAEDHARSLVPSNSAGETQEIERRSNEITAVHVRRLAFAEMLPNYARLAVVQTCLRPAPSGRLRASCQNTRWHLIALAEAGRGSRQNA